MQERRDSCWTGGVCCFQRARAALDIHLPPAAVGLRLSERTLTLCLPSSSGRPAAPPAACWRSPWEPQGWCLSGGHGPMGKRCERRRRYRLPCALEQVCGCSPCPCFSPSPSQPVGEFPQYHISSCVFFACVPPPLLESPAPVLVIKQGPFRQGILNLEQFWEVSGFSIHNLPQSLGGFFMLLVFVLF